jgi:predicted transcriptional regulator
VAAAEAGATRTPRTGLLDSATDGIPTLPASSTTCSVPEVGRAPCDRRSRGHALSRGGPSDPGSYTCYTFTVKTAVSLPDDLFERAEHAARQLGVNRSQLYARALTRYLQDIGPDPVTERLNDLAAELARERTTLPSSAAARSMIDSGNWEW